MSQKAEDEGAKSWPRVQRWPAEKAQDLMAQRQGRKGEGPMRGKRRPREKESRREVALAAMKADQESKAMRDQGRQPRQGTVGRCFQGQRRQDAGGPLNSPAKVGRSRE